MAFAAVSFVVSAIVIGAVISYLYSLDYHLRNHPPSEVWLGCVGSVLLLSLLVSATAAAWSRSRKRPAIASACMTGLTIWCVLVLYTWIVLARLPRGFGWHVLDLTNARYFAEWQWLNFVGLVAPTCATLGAVIAWIRMRRYRSSQALT